MKRITESVYLLRFPPFLSTMPIFRITQPGATMMHLQALSLRVTQDTHGKKARLILSLAHTGYSEQALQDQARTVSSLLNQLLACLREAKLVGEVISIGGEWMGPQLFWEFSASAGLPKNKALHQTALDLFYHTLQALGVRPEQYLLEREPGESFELSCRQETKVVLPGNVVVPLVDLWLSNFKAPKPLQGTSI